MSRTRGRPSGPSSTGSRSPLSRRSQEVLTDGALAFPRRAATAAFTPRRNELLAPAARSAAPRSPGTGTLDFLPDTASVRDGGLAGRSGPGPP